MRYPRSGAVHRNGTAQVSSEERYSLAVSTLRCGTQGRYSQGIEQGTLFTCGILASVRYTGTVQPGYRARNVLHMRYTGTVLPGNGPITLFTSGMMGRVRRLALRIVFGKFIGRDEMVAEWLAGQDTDSPSSVLFWLGEFFFFHFQKFELMFYFC